MIRFANAKINLGLNILRKREDGYHDISTAFYPIGLHCGTHSDSGMMCDVLEITPGRCDALSLEGNKIEGPLDDNLVWKALQLFRTFYPQLPPVQISLVKNIPSQAGLGGGSSDASVTLSMLNEMVGNPFDKPELADMALQLGADCPFFVYNKPMVASGVGERMSQIELNLSGYTAVILQPDERISTKVAFSGVKPRMPDISIEHIIAAPVSEWKHCLKNDFEDSLFQQFPNLKEIKDYLYRTRAVYASLTGSGSAFYGLYDSAEEAMNASLSAPTRFATTALL